MAVDFLEGQPDRLKSDPDMRFGFLDRTIPVRDLLGVVWRGKWFLAACVIIFLVLGSRTYDGISYSAQMMLVPAESDASQPPSAAGSSLFSSLGLSSGGTVSKFVEFQKALQSVAVASLLEQRFGVLCTVYGAECDPATKQWHAPADYWSNLTTVAKSVFGIPDVYQARTVVDLAAFLRGRVVIRPDGGTIMVSLTSADPKFAVDFLRKVYLTTDDYLKLHDKAYLKQYVDYLSAKISAGNLAEREAIQALLLEQERRLMLSEVDVPYAAAPLDPPSAFPEDPLLKILAIWGVLGVIVGTALIFLSGHIHGRWIARRTAAKKNLVMR